MKQLQMTGYIHISLRCFDTMSAMRTYKANHGNILFAAAAQNLVVIRTCISIGSNIGKEHAIAYPTAYCMILILTGTHYAVFHSYVPSIYLTLSEARNISNTAASFAALCSAVRTSGFSYITMFSFGSIHS